MKEGEITDEILLAASNLGNRLFRQNVGRAWVGKLVSHKDGITILKNSRPFHAGLCKGSGDTIGFTPVTVTQDMVGTTLAVFTSVEVKAGRTPISKHQKLWHNMVNTMGGISVIARSVADYLDAVGKDDADGG